MDLKTFVTETLTQIVEGVADAQKRLAEGDTNAVINPVTRTSDVKHKHGDATAVEFDVALVAVSETNESSGSRIKGSMGFLSVVSGKFEAGGETSAGAGTKSESVSRVKFSVNLAQPAFIKESNWSSASEAPRRFV